MAGIADKVFSLIKETVEQTGVSLWDVKYVKEGASYYLRVFIDKPEGISIDDCTDVSHAIDPVIDEADPIDGSYYLEVCSPGIERELSRDAHYEYAVGKKVRIRLFKAVDGIKEFSGTLVSCSEGIVLETEQGNVTFERSAVSKASIAEE